MHNLTRFLKAEQDTQLLFREGQGDYLPSCCQDFTEYWHENSR